MRYAIICIVSFWSMTAFAADVTVEMLNKLDNEIWFFQKKL